MRMEPACRKDAAQVQQIDPTTRSRLELAALGWHIGITNPIGTLTRDGKPADKFAHFRAMPAGGQPLPANMPTWARPAGHENLDPLPPLKGAYYWATQDRQIVAYWSEKYPGCNTLIANLPEDIAVLDLDDPDLFEECHPGFLAQLMGDNCPTDKSRREGGGYHVFVRVPEGMTSEDLPSVCTWGEIKKSNGLVVSSPSEKYKNLVPFCRPDQVPRLRVSDVEDLRRFDAAKKAAAEPTQAAADRGIPEGSRNDTLFRKAAKARSAGFNGQEIFGLLQGANESCRPPLQDAELRNIARSACRYEPGQDAENKGPTIHSRTGQDISGLLSETELEQLPGATMLYEFGIPDYGLGIITAKQAVGKSQLALAMGQSIARNIPFLGQMPKRTGYVVFLLAESVPSYKGRNLALRDRLGLEPTDQVLFKVTNVNIGTAEGFNHLDELIKSEAQRRGSPPAHIFVDTLSASSGGIDENTDMQPVMDRLQNWVTRGIPVTVLHHPSKGGEPVRGSSKIGASADWIIQINKTGHARKFVAIKLRDSEEIDLPGFTVVDHKGQPVIEPLVDPAGITTPGTIKSTVRDLVLLGDRPISILAIYSAIPADDDQATVRQRNLMRYLKHLVNSDAIVSSTHLKVSKYHEQKDAKVWVK